MSAKNNMHISDKTPFGYATGSRKTPQPPMATTQGITNRAKGNSAPGQAANAAMRKSPGKK